MRTAVDTNVLLDVLAGDEAASDASGRALREASRGGPLVICPVVYSELAAAFDQQEDLDAFLSDMSVRPEPFTDAALWLSARAWRLYSRRRGRHVQCPHCGHQFESRCPNCGAVVSWRQHIISDFLIGGHAAQQADVLLTRDRGYYQTYFPVLRLQGSEG